MGWMSETYSWNISEVISTVYKMKYNLYKDYRSVMKELWRKTWFFLLALKQPLHKFNRNLTDLSIAYPYAIKSLEK